MDLVGIYCTMEIVHSGLEADTSGHKMWGTCKSHQRSSKAEGPLNNQVHKMTRPINLIQFLFLAMKVLGHWGHKQSRQNMGLYIRTETWHPLIEVGLAISTAECLIYLQQRSMLYLQDTISLKKGPTQHFVAIWLHWTPSILERTDQGSA